MRLILVITLAIVAITCGALFQYKPYHTYEIGFGDQHPLDHRESAYSSITWMVSDADNFQQLKFFDRVEGGICLRPTWDDLIALAEKEPTLRHLVPDSASRPKPMIGGPDWPHQWLPDPGTVTNSAYIRLFPVGVLLNNDVMTRAGDDLQKADPKILVVGLGSGIGIANLAHHFPQASITVVDIDQVVEDMVRDHYPLLAWLLTQKLANGDPRLRFEVGDARKYIRYDAKREKRPYDMVLLDAYTSGSTIPPHLMTVEFFNECSNILSADGIVFANVIGSLTGDKRLVSGGAIRSFRAAGLTHLWLFPVLLPGEGPGRAPKTEHSRNNIVVCSRKPLDPRLNAAGWERLKQFVPYPQLLRGSSISAGYVLANETQYNSALLPASLIDAALPALRARMSAQPKTPDQLQYAQVSLSKDRDLIDQVFRAAQEAVTKGALRELPKGWTDRAAAVILERRETDWVIAARDLYRFVIQMARDPNYSGEALVGPLEAERTPGMPVTWTIKDAPLFTDQMPNADIFNN